MNVENIYTILNINVTWYCPVRCRHCHIRSRASLSDKAVLSEQDLLEACRSANEAGINEYRISGGEPTTLSARLFDFADMIYTTTNCKPNLLTSGFGISDEWMKRAEGKFAGIFISVENPIQPMQKVVNVDDVLRLIKNNRTESLDFRYGLTLIEASQFKNIERVFNMLYENSGGRVFPQLDYPSLLSFHQPTRSQLDQLYSQSKRLFRKYGVVPYYFPNIIGSMLYVNKKVHRVLVNMNPDGKFDIHESLNEALSYEIKWREHCLDQQTQSYECNRCDWIDVCKSHSGFWRGIRYDWCPMRKAIFTGIMDGLGNDEGVAIENALSY